MSGLHRSVVARFGRYVDGVHVLMKLMMMVSMAVKTGYVSDDEACAVVDRYADDDGCTDDEGSADDVG